MDKTRANNAINADSENRRSFVASLFTAGYGERYAQRALMRTLAIGALLISFSASASITEGGRGMLFGVDHAFAVTAKSGWVLDNQSGVDQGLHMVFYPKGGTWSDSPVIIYGRAVPTAEVANIKTHVENTVSEFRKNGSPNYISKQQPPLTLKNGPKSRDLLLFG